VPQVAAAQVVVAAAAIKAPVYELSENIQFLQSVFLYAEVLPHQLDLEHHRLHLPLQLAQAEGHEVSAGATQIVANDGVLDEVMAEQNVSGTQQVAASKVPHVAPAQEAPAIKAPV